MTYVENMICDLKKEKNGIYLYGAGVVADIIRKRLEKNGIEISGYLVDEKYIPLDESNRYIDGKRIFAKKELDKDSAVVLAIQKGLHESSDISTIADFSSRYIFDPIGFVHGAYDDTMLIDHKERFCGLYEKMSDFESRESLLLFISQKLSGMYTKPYSHSPEYFDERIIVPGDNETFIDCGAYTGDSCIGFFEFLKRNNIKTYNKCVAFEPDPENFRKMEKNLKFYKNIEMLNAGAYDKKDVLHFSPGKDMGSRLDSAGKISVNVDSIDNVLNGEEATIIKMDIEGAELSALKGAEKTIRKYKPRLAICVYHKTDDLLTIPDYILSINPDYKLYFRNYCAQSCDAILYAV
ncbi:MAG: FkbM family methyltransferase [Ruminiclostridium sp.]|nr:FkbM family methyltransferase [Ruminiclostridium sp.]